MLIDGHQHYWQIGHNGHNGHNGHGWPTPDLVSIYRDFGATDWDAVANPLGIAGSVAVQSQPCAADTVWLLELARRTPSIKAVVGWADLKADGAVQTVRQLARTPELKGLRPMLQNLADDDWIIDSTLDPAIDAMIESDLRFDALVYTRHLPHLRRFARRWPELRIVIDHGAKPPIANGRDHIWRAEMGLLASLPNVTCKLSGLMTEMRPDQDRAALEPYVRYLCDLFGPERLMWGSDWPVLLLAGGYSEWHSLAERYSGFDAAGLALLFGGTAARFYGLEA